MQKDHCTLFAEGNWSDCCKRHDRRYSNKRISRREADILLLRCVKRKNRAVAYIMYVGVRLAGWYFYKKC